MKCNKLAAITILALSGVLAGNTTAADATKPASPPAEKKAETAKPTAEDIAKLEADAGLNDEQKAQVNALLNELKEKRRAIKEDASLSSEEKKAKTKALNQEIQGKDGKIKAVMTVEQFAKWEKLQEARRAVRN
jgi:periplasmic protein CpxP/Spy